MRISDWSSDVCSSDLPFSFYSTIYFVESLTHKCDKHLYKKATQLLTFVTTQGTAPHKVFTDNIVYVYVFTPGGSKEWTHQAMTGFVVSAKKDYFSSLDRKSTRLNSSH